MNARNLLCIPILEHLPGLRPQAWASATVVLNDRVTVRIVIVAGAFFPRVDNAVVDDFVFHLVWHRVIIKY